MSQTVEKVKAFYRTFSLESLEKLDEIYAENVVFVDPVHEVRGREALQRYFRGIMQNLESCMFEFYAEQSGDNWATLEWVMTFEHPKLQRGRQLSLPGVTVVRFDDEGVAEHRDYYDLGAMVYEHIPVVGRVVKWLKSKLSAH